MSPPRPHPWLKPKVEHGSVLEGALRKRGDREAGCVVTITKEELDAIRIYDESWMPLYASFTEAEKDRRMKALEIAQRCMQAVPVESVPPSERPTLWEIADALVAYVERGEKPEPPA